MVISLHQEGRWRALNLASFYGCLPELNAKRDSIVAHIFNLGMNFVMHFVLLWPDSDFYLSVCSRG